MKETNKNNSVAFFSSMHQVLVCSCDCTCDGGDSGACAK